MGGQIRPIPLPPPYRLSSPLSPSSLLGARKNFLFFSPTLSPNVSPSSHPSFRSPLLPSTTPQPVPPLISQLRHEHLSPPSYPVRTLMYVAADYRWYVMQQANYRKNGDAMKYSKKDIYSFSKRYYNTRNETNYNLFTLCILLPSCQLCVNKVLLSIQIKSPVTYCH